MCETAPEVEWIVLTLRSWANLMAARFGAPVLLVGSALQEKYPRDIDIRVVLPDDEFAARYGPWTDIRSPGLVDWPPAARRWAEDCGKQNRWVARFCRLNVDFQVQAAQEVEAQHAGKPSRRLDQIDVEA